MNAAHPVVGRAGGRFRATLWVLATVACAVLVLSALASVFTLDITEHGLVTRFGRVVRLVEEPGLGFKLPFERVQRFDKRLLYLSTQPKEYVTADRKNVIVATLATWRVAEPTRFLATLRTRGEAEQRLTDAIVGEAGAVIGRHDFDSLVAPHASDDRFGAIIAEVRLGIQALVSRAYGIEVVDLGVRDLALPPAEPAERLRADESGARSHHHAAALRGESRVEAHYRGS